MSYFIEQTREQASDAFALLNRTDLDQVRVVESSTRCRISPSSEHANLYFDIDFSPESARVDGRDILVLTRFTFSLREDQDKDGPNLIDVFAIFEATYAVVTSDYKPTESQLDAFRRANAIFNCWPYFREYVHNIFTRMGFPPPPVPFLRLVPKLAEATDKSKALALTPPEKPALKRSRAKRRLPKRS